MIKLPPPQRKESPDRIDNARQISIIGGNGAGKSLFMDEMTAMCGDRAYCLSALDAFYPERAESTAPGSIDDLYRNAVRQQNYMRTDAVSQLDKLLYMLIADEFESLLALKEDLHKSGHRFKPAPSKLDIIQRHWERIFPGNKIRRERGSLRFETSSGAALISPHSLSQGENTVLYYLAASLYAMPDAVVFIDSPTLFVHPSIISNLWNSIEDLRPDCTFVYNSVDEDFVNTRTHNTCIWVKSFDSEHKTWDYAILDGGSLTEDMMVEFAGSRRPVLFIEGDASHSIDMRLYSLVFKDMTVKPVGSCNKVIETTRSFNDQQTMHHLSSMGIVDRDRRTDQEVSYLRSRKIMVPEVAEIENLFLLPEVITVMARRRGLNEKPILRRVEKYVTRLFARQADQQALQHVRHRVKREVECKIDARFSCITALETHLRGLPAKLQPRRQYNELREQFAVLVRDSDYAGILRVFNHKPMLPDSGVHQLLGFRSKEEYIAGVLDALKSTGKDSEALRQCIRRCLRYEETGASGAENKKKTVHIK